MTEINFSPFPCLQTKRCCLRRILDEDAGEILLLRSDEAIMRYMDRKKMISLDEAKDFINLIESGIKNNAAISWGICLNDSDKLIGTIGFWRILKEHFRAEIGYVLHPAYWKQGIMSEVIPEVIRYGLEQLKLHSIEANVNPANIPSIRLLEKSGFVREAYFKENYYFDGKFLDSLIYSMVAPK